MGLRILRLFVRLCLSSACEANESQYHSICCCVNKKKTGQELFLLLLLLGELWVDFDCGLYFGYTGSRYNIILSRHE